jgi:hypothetical protein
MLCLAGTLTSLGKPYARLWSANFDDAYFYRGLEQWLKTGSIARTTPATCTPSPPTTRC